MKINKCSNCGRHGSQKNKIGFDEREFKLKIKNYKGVKYNLMLDFWVIPEHDETLIKEFENTKYNSEDEINQAALLLDNKIIDNSPVLCTKCRKALANFTLQFGRQDKFVNF